MSVHVAGVPTVAASGVDQPFGYWLRLAASSAGRACQVTARATSTTASHRTAATSSRRRPCRGSMRLLAIAAASTVITSVGRGFALHFLCSLFLGNFQLERDF